MELDFTEQILAKIIKECGNEEEITQEAWASEKNKGKTLNKPFRTSGGPKKFSVYVKNEKGNIVKVNFGDPNMEIKRDDPARRKSFRARHNCDNPGPKTKAKYWSCKMWSKKSVTKVTKGEADMEDEMVEFLDESESALTEQQKKLPPAIQKSILKKKGGKDKDSKDKDSKDKDSKDKDSKDKKEDKEKGKEESDAKKGLWENIRDKKKREGKNYRPAKPGDKDYPDPKALKKAQKSSEKKKDK